MTRLGVVLKEKGISQKEIALYCGVSQPTVSEWVSGRKMPSSDNLAKLSARLDVTMNYLVGAEDSNDQPLHKPVSEEDLKIALFGGEGEVTDDMWEEVKRFAEFVKQKNMQ